MRDPIDGDARLDLDLDLALALTIRADDLTAPTT
jgi:hypothetical protein